MSTHRHRLEMRKARRKRTGRALSPADRGPDPLLSGKRKSRMRSAGVAVLLAVALGVHVAVALAIAGVNRLLDDGAKQLREERIKVAIVEQKPPPPPPPEPKPKPKPKPEQPTPKPKRRPKPKPLVRERPRPPPQPTPPAPSPPRRIVGLRFESTVQAGKGPGFAVGNTLLGQTAGTASDPKLARAVPPPAPRAAATNRRASYVAQKGDSIELPRWIGRVKPEYPELLRAQNIEGQVVLEVRIDRRGRVVAVKIVKASPHAEFNANAVEAAYRQRYTPARKNGKPFVYTLAYPVKYRLNDKG
ncbi:MAG: energy transducer TonB [Proteobacteria bacterium]|nr:energy transducer TonB [Pseudomonadota bacterium]